MFMVSFLRPKWLLFDGNYTLISYKIYIPDYECNTVDSGY